MTLHEIIADLDARIATEDARVTEGIAEAVRNHTSVHEGYWKHAWELRQRRKAAQIVADVLAEVVA